MTDDQLRVRVAELCGWRNLYQGENHGLLVGDIGSSDGHCCRVPDYPRDLNACAEMERTLATDDEISAYVDALTERAGGDTPKGIASFCAYFATARQRCEAFVAVKEGRK